MFKIIPSPPFKIIMHPSPTTIRLWRASPVSFVALLNSGMDAVIYLGPWSVISKQKF